MSLRYPEWYTTRQEYCDKIGDLRETILKEIFEKELFYQVVRHKTHGIDLVLKEKKQMPKVNAVVECSNEDYGSFYDRNSILSKLFLFNPYSNIPKFWILSFKSSLYGKGQITPTMLGRFKVTIIEIGFQTLPQRDYEWFEKRGEAKFRRPNDKTSYDLTVAEVSKYIPRCW